MIEFIPPGQEYGNFNVYTEKVGFSTLESKFENGASQRRAKWHYPLRLFTLQYEALEQEEAETILNFFISRKGSFEAFSWLNPNDNIYYTVVFDEDFINLARFAYQLYTLGEVRLREIR